MIPTFARGARTSTTLHGAGRPGPVPEPRRVTVRVAVLAGSLGVADSLIHGLYVACSVGYSLLVLILQ
jgi:hypothetical protein